MDEHLGTISIWKPQIDASVGDLKLEVAVLRKHLDRMLLEHDSPSPGLLVTPEMAAAASPAEQPAVGPAGHRNDTHHRERGFGCVTTLSHLPVKGTHKFPPHKHGGDDFYTGARMGSQSLHVPPITSPYHHNKIPKIHFPQFDGSHPKLWTSRCEDYFELYSVDPSIWIKVASMHFSGAAARWLQALERRIRHVSWNEFCEMLLERFGRDQHDILIRQLFHIKQVGSVSEYIEQFSKLVDQLNAYESVTDSCYYTMRFIDGLKDEIKSVVLV